MIEVCSLASGSNGNAFFVKAGDNAFLVDAGISCRQICLRLAQIGHSPEEIKGVFISHEHSDHVRGLRVLLKRFPMPVYITEKTFENMSDAGIDEDCLRFIRSEDTVAVDHTTIQSLPKSHDAADPSLFCFYHGKKKIGIVTDVGYACDNVIAAVRDADILFLESNYDETMLREGFYPAYLKRRIASNYGHLSNAHAGELILEHASAHLDSVFLSHLSENNNTPDTALATFASFVNEREDLRHLKVVVTSRHGVSETIRIR